MKKHFKAVELKYLDDETIMKIREWRNQPFVKNMMYSQHEITEEEHRNYVASLKKNENKGLFVFYLDDEPFGVYQYEFHDNGKYVTGGNYLISEGYINSGLGIIQIYFMMEIMFEYLNANKEYSEVLDVNKHMISINRKLKKTQEGILRQQCLIDGEYHDVYCYGILNREWSDRRAYFDKLVFSLIDREYEIMF